MMIHDEDSHLDAIGMTDEEFRRRRDDPDLLRAQIARAEAARAEFEAALVECKKERARLIAQLAEARRP